MVAPVFSTTENPIVGIKNKTIKDKQGNPIQYVEFKFEDGTTQDVKSPRREAQKTTQQMVDGTISKEE